MLLNELYKLQEKSTQYYYFSDEILNAIESDDKVYSFVSDWIFSQGPGSDERYVPDLTPEDYFDVLQPSEIEYLEKEIRKRFGVKEEEEKPSKELEAKDDKKEEPKKKKSFPVTIGTLVLITNFGSDKEPRKQMWNKSRGEVLAINKDGSYKVRVTDVKDSNVLYSKNWYDNEQGALKQKLNLKRDEFKTLPEVEAEENEGK